MIHMSKIGAMGVVGEDVGEFGAGFGRVVAGEVEFGKWTLASIWVFGYLGM